MLVQSSSEDFKNCFQVEFMVESVLADRYDSENIDCQPLVIWFLHNFGRLYNQ
jgi:hypothetical protein